jgi:2-keto-4-pentenoate hydratase
VTSDEEVNVETSLVRNAAELIAQSRLNHRPLGRLPTESRPVDERDGYFLQQAVHECLTANGQGSIVGYKIGCTTKVMQDYLKIPNPCAGGVFEDSVRIGVGNFALADFVRVGVECEIAVRLGSDLSPHDRPFTRSAVADAVSGCMAAIEVVDDRYADYSSLGAATLIADDFFGAGCVLGEEVGGFNPRELVNASAYMQINGVIIGQGSGVDVLGDPLDALVWLADNMADYGSGLSAGQFVLLGSLVKPCWLDSTSDVVAVNTPLGSVTARFA